MWNENLGKCLTVQELIDLLEDLKDKDWLVAVSKVGNLLIRDSNGEEYIGFVDFADGSLELSDKLEG